MVEFFEVLTPQLKIFITLNEIVMLMKKISINTKHGMKKIGKYGEKIKG